MCCLWCLVNLSAYLCTTFNHVHFAIIPIWKCATHKGISYLRWFMANWYHSYFAFISNDRSAYLMHKFNQVHFAIIPIWKCATHYCTSYLRWFVANWYLSYFAFISNDRSAYLMHKVQSSAFCYYSYLEVCYPLLYFLFKIIHCNWQPFINCLHLEW